MRILLVSNVYPPNFIGGAEIIAHEQAKVLKSLDHQVQVFAGEVQSFGDHYELRRDLFDGLVVYRCSMEPGDYDPRYTNFSNGAIEDRFSEVLEAFEPEIVHGHNLIGLSAALPRLAQRAGAATVVTLHDHWGFCFKNTLLKRGERICEDSTRCAECLPSIENQAGREAPIRMRNDFLKVALANVDCLVSPSRYLAEAYVRAGLPRGQIRVIPYGIDVERFRRIRPRVGSAKELRLTFVGALYPHKGVATLVEALGYLPDDFRVRVNLVGTGTERKRCEQILMQNNRADRVKFWGQIDNQEVDRVYAETDALVLPSIWPENQPVSITEAMASGLPAIVSDLGGMPELVEDGVTGKIFRAGDPRDLARCIGLLGQNRELTASFGAAARERMKAFSLTAQVKQLEELYRSLSQRPPVRRAERRLVICWGRSFDRDSARVMEEFPVSEGWRFVLREWVDEELVRSGWLHWVADESPAARDLAESATAPLLVKTINHSLLRAAFESQCALYYSAPDQAVRCMRLLDSDQRLYQSLEVATSDLASASRATLRGNR